MLILLHLPYFFKPAFFSFLSFLLNLFSEILFPLIPKNSGVSGAKQNATYGKTASVFTLGFTEKKRLWLASEKLARALIQNGSSVGSFVVGLGSI